MKFIDVKIDTAFKKVFGDHKHKDILIDFLNSVLPFEGDAKIETLEILNPNNAPLTMLSKDSYVDVKVRLSDNRQIFIEMQMCKVGNFAKRVFYNTTHAYSSQIFRGMDYTKLFNIISLNIVNFNLCNDCEDIVTKFKLVSDKGKAYYEPDILEILFVELPKFQKQETELFNKMDKWFYFLKNVDHLTNVPKVLANEATIKEAFHILDEALLTEEETKAYLGRRDFLINNISFQEEVRQEGRKERIKEGEKVGLEKGEKVGLEKVIEKGEKVGLEKRTLDVAKNMLAKNLDIELISDITGLSVEEIEELKV